MARAGCLMLAAVLMTGCKPGRPPAADPQTSAAPQASKRPDSPRVVLTDRAAKEVRQNLAELPEARYLRVSVTGERFKLDLDAATDPEKDLLSESRGVPIVLDRQSSTLLPVGIVVDCVDADGAKKFKFVSPGGDRDRSDLGGSLTGARRGFKTTLRPSPAGELKSPVQEPPAEIFRVVRYDAPPGRLAAYLTPDPQDGKKHPAIIWITGGDCNTIDSGCWRDGGALGDQSASAYRNAGIVMMFPSLRGGNDNPGRKEGFLGEVDDILAAAAFLRKQPYVDPARIYLGGHSTGGTMALLTAECSSSFRAVFSFGPIDDVLGYGLGFNPFVLTEPEELRLRCPAQWLHEIRSPVFVFEGAAGGNADALRSMADKTTNTQVRFFVIDGADHFNLLGPTNRLIAEKVLRDTGPACNLAFTAAEVNKPFRK